MPNEVISYLEMCQREGASLQRGMNFRLGKNHSVILMSVQPNAPYEDRIEEGGSVIIYEGHDVPKTQGNRNPKFVDQAEFLPSGKLTENGKFHKAAQKFKSQGTPPERIRVYEKIKKGIWAYNGLFNLIDSWIEASGGRKVFKFKLLAIEEDDEFSLKPRATPVRRRMIPTHVKLAVWKRDGGKCAICGATEDLHFDHIIPYSKGGSSDTEDNIQLLCSKHNLEKHDKIQ